MASLQAFLSFLPRALKFPLPLFINYTPLRLATVPFFATIVFDEARPKVLCIHTKLIIVCRVCYGNQNSKNVLFRSFR